MLKLIDGKIGLGPNQIFIVAIVGTIVLLSSCIILFTKLRGASNCQVQYRHDLQIEHVNMTLYAQTAQTEAEREQGLSGKTCMPADQAMLFEFDKEGYYPFWAKDMKFPIDIVWVSASKQVTDLQRTVTPQSYPQTYTNSKPAKYVIEMVAGEAYNYKLVPGAQLDF